MKSVLGTKLIWLCAGLMLGLASGCSTVPRTEQMKPVSVVVETCHTQSVHVAVAVDATAVQHNGSAITADEDAQFGKSMETAVVKCIADSRLFQVAAAAGGSDLTLNVTVLRCDYAARSTGVTGAQGGPSATVHLVARWCLKNGANGNVICEKDITTANTHDAADYIVGGAMTASRSATEAATAANVKQGVEWLSRRTRSL